MKTRMYRLKRFDITKINPDRVGLTWGIFSLAAVISMFASIFSHHEHYSLVVLTFILCIFTLGFNLLEYFARKKKDRYTELNWKSYMWILNTSIWFIILIMFS